MKQLHIDPNNEGYHPDLMRLTDDELRTALVSTADGKLRDALRAEAKWRADYRAPKK